MENKKEVSLEDIRMFTKRMSHDQILNEIKEGLHYLTTTELVDLHADISQVQLKRAHAQREEHTTQYIPKRIM